MKQAAESLAVTVEQSENGNPSGADGRELRSVAARQHTRKAKNWVMPEADSSKLDRFLQRSLCFTGILFVDGIIVPPHEWSRFESAANDSE